MRAVPVGSHMTSAALRFATSCALACQSVWPCSSPGTRPVLCSSYNIVSPGDLRDAAQRLDTFASSAAS